MPERVTKEERIISLAIEKARKAKAELSAKKRMNIEPTQVLEIDTDPEVEKIKRPTVQDASKITNQTQKNEGYGLAGESLKKQDKPKRMVSFKNTTKDVRSADSYLSPEKRREKQDKPKEPFKTRIIKKDFKDMRNLLSKLEFTTNRLVEDLYANLRENPTKMNRRNFDAIQQISRLINDDNDGAVAIARGIEFIIWGILHAASYWEG